MVTAQAEWLGFHEGAQLEYKSAAAIEHPEAIVRAVVALLNHRGGHVVVGADDAGKPEGFREGVDLDRARDRLQSLLIDGIEPRPIGQVDVRRQNVLGVDVLEIQVSRSSGSKSTRLYAERRHGMYGFWIRAGATTRAYSLDEIRNQFSEKNAAQVPSRWDAPLVRDNEPDIVFVLQAEVVEGDALARDAVERVLSPDARSVLHRRSMSWSVIDEYDDVQRLPRKLLAAGKSGDRKWLSVDLKSSIIRFEGRADFLRWKRHPIFEDRVIYPFPLVEGAASFFWLLARYGKESKSQASLHCQLGLWRPEGWRLGPSRPGTIAWDSTRMWMPPHDNTSIERVAMRELGEICDNADQVARGFIAEVYEDFGYDIAAVPFWSHEAQRFIFE